MNSITKFVFSMVFFLVGAGLHAQTDILFEKNLETKREALLTVQTEGADVALSVWNKRRVLVVVRGLKKSAEFLDISVNKIEEGVSVSVKKAKDKKILGWGGIQFASVEILVPESCRIQANTAGGDIKISNVIGSVELDSGGGDITVAATTGDLRAYSAGGDLSLSGTTGTVDISSGGGDIRALLLHGPFKAISDSGDVFFEGEDGALSVYSASGDCTIHYRGKNEGMDIRSSSGNIFLAIPEDFSANLECTSRSGSVTAKIPTATVFAKSSTKYEAALNGGGPLIALRTQSGSIAATAQ